MLEGQITLNYRSACWMISLGYNEYLKSRSDVNSQPAEYEQNFSISFSLLGLAGALRLEPQAQPLAVMLLPMAVRSTSTTNQMSRHLAATSSDLTRRGA